MEVQTNNHQLIWKSTLILSLAGFITKILSAAYRIPFQNMAGDIGFYIYQQVYPLYGIALILSTYGFPVIISKLIAEHIHSKKDEMMRILVICFVFLSILCFIIFLILYIGAEQIAFIMGDKELYILLKVVSFSFLFVPVLSVIRGYFQGQGNMTPTALSQIGEQSIRVTTILVFSYLLLTDGYSIYIGGAGAIYGSITGGFVSGLILIYFWIQKGQINSKPISNNRSKIRIRPIIKTLLIQGFTICISSLFLVLLQLVDAMTIFSQLSSSGQFSITEAKILKGVFDRGQPLIQLGTVIATSLSLTLVPFIASAKTRNDYHFIRAKVHLTIRVSVVVGLGASLGLIGIIKPTNRMLFENTDGSDVLAILALTILFSSITMTTTAIIQGLGQSIVPAINVLIGVGCKIALNLLFIPQLETGGAAIATVISFFITTLLNSWYLSTYLCMALLTSYIKKVLFAGTCMLVSLYIYQLILNMVFFHQVNSRLFATLQSLTGVLIGGAIYLFIVIKIKVFTKQELMVLPFGRKLSILMQKQT